MSLNDHIHQLTREHLKTSPDGQLRHAPALLTELRSAVTPGNTGSAGGASGPPIPINPEAVDTLTRFTKDANADFRAMTGKYWTGTLEALLQHFAWMDLAPVWNAYLEGLTLEWVEQITAFLWPVKPRRKLTGKGCPACGLALHGDDRAVCLSLGCWDDAGNLAKIGEWDIECGACGAQWSGHQVAWLLRALDTPITTWQTWANSAMLSHVSPEVSKQSGRSSGSAFFVARNLPPGPQHLKPRRPP